MPAMVLTAFLDLARDFALDDLGRGAGVVGLTTTTGKSTFGKLVDLQALVGEQAQHHEGQHHHGGEDRVLMLTRVNHMA